MGNLKASKEMITQSKTSSHDNTSSIKSTNERQQTLERINMIVNLSLTCKDPCNGFPYYTLLTAWIMIFFLLFTLFPRNRYIKESKA